MDGFRSFRTFSHKWRGHIVAPNATLNSNESFAPTVETFINSEKFPNLLHSVIAWKKGSHVLCVLHFSQYNSWLLEIFVVAVHNALVNFCTGCLFTNMTFRVAISVEFIWNLTMLSYRGVASWEILAWCDWLVTCCANLGNCDIWRANLFMSRTGSLCLVVHS